MADEPIPASQANTMFWIGPSWPRAAEPASALEAIDFLPFMSSICEVASIRSPSSLRSIFSRTAPTRKETRAAPKTPTVMPKKSPLGVCA